MPSKKTADAVPSLEQLKEEIGKMAERIYSERQAKHLAGDEVSDWLAAEKKIKAKYKL